LLFTGIFIAILLTYSRGGYLAFIFSIFLFFLLKRKKKEILLFLLLIVFGIFVIPKSIKSEGVVLLRTVSIKNRILSMGNAINIFSQSPFYGIGFNTYRYAQARSGSFKNDKIVSHSGAGVDNSFIFVLATTGIIGFASYVYMWYRIILEKYHEYLRQKKLQGNLSIIFISSTVGIFISSLFINSLFYPFILEWIWILLAITENN
ncbi:MAG: O-antigen ligase family protein, partial [Patescibacteria group bacterium]|nr:O-antigen ligase family protein [Patescibacteria group bacterium]